MLATVSTASRNWLFAGREIFPALLEAINGARESIRLEMYIYEPGALGTQFLEALVRAQQRGVQVRVLLDALGSINLPATFWDPLRSAGGQARQFNPLRLHRMAIRDHRKCLICDDQIAFIGGFNIAQEYDGDGVTSGWCDVGLKLQGPIVSELAGQSLYRRFLKAGVEIFEYQPQILHTKLIIIDDVIYLGSANLDQRSLNINYELMIRFESRQMAEQART